MLAQLCESAERVAATIAQHMQREEAEVFPLLEASLCAAQQRAMVWRTLRAMPLRLLERVMPWVTGGPGLGVGGEGRGWGWATAGVVRGMDVAGDGRAGEPRRCGARYASAGSRVGTLPPEVLPARVRCPFGGLNLWPCACARAAKLSDEDTAELLNNIRLGAPEPDTALVELLSRWAGRGRVKARQAKHLHAANGQGAGEQLLQQGAAAAAVAGGEASATSQLAHESEENTWPWGLSGEPGREAKRGGAVRVGVRAGGWRG